MIEIDLHPKWTWKHSLTRYIVLGVVELFYPNFEVTGQENLPEKEEPAIYVLNHHNFLLDGLMLPIGLDRDTGCMGKSTFFSYPISRLALETFGAIPVYRKKDDGQSYGPNGDVAERNQFVLAHCRRLLLDGKSFVIFPEGTTHSENRLLPLQAGAARIALQAEAESDWQRDIKVVPVGVCYEEKTKFRSNVHLVISQPLSVQTYQESYDTDPQQASKDFIAQISKALTEAWKQANQVETTQFTPITPWQGIRMLLFLLISMPLAGIGWLMNYVPYKVTEPLVTRYFDKRSTRQATGKMLVNMALLPIIWITLAILCSFIFGPIWGGLLLVGGPSMSYLALRWGEVFHVLISQFTFRAKALMGQRM
ncbi:1-acyl-sn-glycerol-3-phosphate acyltransferase [Anaerolineales bacterium HSG25]|nr:1-acyl-sn-glycerol-3-phosphate acyltransferase [Anaerolineales bacterium HSG25]